MRQPTRQQIEKAAAAVIGLMRTEAGTWNPAFVASAKWPKDFYPSERKEARIVAEAALRAALSE